jgi:hypothetical protein
VRRLRNRDVRVLVDVSEIGRSRRPEFNERFLATALERAGIRYQHALELGSPSAMRRALYESGDFERFAGLYLAYVRRRRLDDVASLTRLVRREGTVCILCAPGIEGGLLLPSAHHWRHRGRFRYVVRAADRVPEPLLVGRTGSGDRARRDYVLRRA